MLKKIWLVSYIAHHISYSKRGIKIIHFPLDENALSVMTDWASKGEEFKTHINNIKGISLIYIEHL